jgi:cupin fold WbuC family metalloprotein
MADMILGSIEVSALSDEVFVAKAPVIRVDMVTIEALKLKAAASNLKRSRLCAHKHSDSTLHEMLIVLSKGCYVRPHRHDQKSESFHVVEGLVDVVLFDENGGITEVVKMGDSQSGLDFYYRISDPIFHTPIMRSDVVVLHETTNGPFNKEDTIYAPWAPEEDDSEAVQSYLEQL